MFQKRAPVYQDAILETLARFGAHDPKETGTLLLTAEQAKALKVLGKWNDAEELVKMAEKAVRTQLRGDSHGVFLDLNPGVKKYVKYLAEKEHTTEPMALTKILERALAKEVPTW